MHCNPKSILKKLVGHGWNARIERKSLLVNESVSKKEFFWTFLITLDLLFSSHFWNYCINYIPTQKAQQVSARNVLKKKTFAVQKETIVNWFYTAVVAIGFRARYCVKAKTPLIKVLYGHRNPIMIVGSFHPVQSSEEKFSHNPFIRESSCHPQPQAESRKQKTRITVVSTA